MSNPGKATGPVKFESKEKITGFIDQVCQENGLDNRDQLASALGVSSSAIYGYIFRREIPEKMHRKMMALKDSMRPIANEKSAATAVAVDLSALSLDELLAEIERRGWKVDLSRLAKETR